MNKLDTYILSQRGIFEGSAYGFIYELENIIARTCHGKILVPGPKQMAIWSNKISDKKTFFLNRLIHRSIGAYESLYLAQETISTSNTKLLLVICLHAAGIEILSSIPEWRSQFDIVAVFAIDSWQFNTYPKETYQLDHLFVPVLEIIDDLHEHFKIPVSLLPFGADVLKCGSASIIRPIDVMSFGRTPMHFHNALSMGLNQPESSYLYYRHASVDRIRYPSNKEYAGRFDHQYRMLFHKMMKRSKIVLAFDPLYNTDQLYESYKINTRPWNFYHSILSLRWFEGCAAGCAVLGKRPKTVLANQLLNWNDATIELPDNPENWVEFTKDLIHDTKRLQSIHQRNFFESLVAHDWRHRIKFILDRLKLDTPPPLLEELGEIKQLVSNQ